MHRFFDSIYGGRRSGTLTVEPRTQDYIEVFYTHRKTQLKTRLLNLKGRSRLL